ncbi:MAG: DNA-directed RNA polymerase subunit D [Candidatus Helarchaeota archaeon]|nr:DNA-directed RNA polymerase subunit D [Candidatus Helarchaeota archaeon]
MVKFGVTTLPWDFSTRVEKRVEWFNKLSGISVKKEWIIELEHIHNSFFLDNYDKIKLKPYTIHISPSKNLFTNEIAETRKRHVNKTCEMIQNFYMKSGGKINRFIIHAETISSTIPYMAPDKKRINFLEESLESLLKKLNNKDITLYIENVPKYNKEGGRSSNYFYRVSKIIDVIKRLHGKGYSNVYVCLDVGHLPSHKAIMNLKNPEFIKHLHVHSPKKKLRHYCDNHGLDMNIFPSDFFQRLFQKLTNIESVILEPNFRIPELKDYKTSNDRIKIIEKTINYLKSQIKSREKPEKKLKEKPEKKLKEKPEKKLREIIIPPVIRISILEQEGNHLKIIVEGINPSLANSLRRVMIAEVPCLAIEDVWIVENNSPLYDEIISHRLGLIPLKTDLESYVLPGVCGCEGEGCPQCQVAFTLKKEAIEEPMIVYAEDLEPEDPVIIPVNPKTPVVELAKGQRIVLEAYAKLGIGEIHAKWQPVATVAYKFLPEIRINYEICEKCEKCVDACPRQILSFKNDRIQISNAMSCNLCKACEEACVTEPDKAIKVAWDSTKFIFAIESSGALPTEKIINMACQILKGKINNFLEQLETL